VLNRDFISKIMAATLLGSLFGWYIHHDLMTWGQRGREAFITYQMRRFDMNMATPRPVFFTVIVTALLAVGFCALYELIAFWLSTAMKGRTSEKGAD
jgi:hypothetical protein